MRTILALAAFGAISSSFPDLPKDRAARLDKGEVVVATRIPEDSNVVYVVSEGVVDAPPERVWALIEKCDGYAGTMPRIAASSELARQETPKGTVVRCRVTADMPFPIPDLTSTTEARHTVGGGRYERAWTLIEGDYHTNAGRWVLTPFADDQTRTLARYELALEPKMPAPKSLVESAQSRTIPKMYESLRTHTKAPSTTAPSPHAAR